MPARQPFTQLCQLAATIRSEVQRADLHLHTTCSDGAWSPEEIVHRAQQRGLGAIAITDHDTVAGVAAAQVAAATKARVAVIAGVEITCSFHNRELHLLGYFFAPDDPDLTAGLAKLQLARRERFQNMIDRLKSIGVAIDEQAMGASTATSLAPGRLVLAAVLAKQGHAPTTHLAFQRFLRDGGPVALPKQMAPVAAALDWVHAAGGVASWAHPSQDITADQVHELKKCGLDALEAVYPAFSARRVQQLRDLARSAGLAVTGGSDCHGPDPVRRAVGAFGITLQELETLRNRRR